jgi:hypothetical protein
LDHLAGGFLKQLAHQGDGVLVKTLFDGLPTDVNPQTADHMPQLRITGLRVGEPSKDDCLGKHGSAQFGGAPLDKTRCTFQSTRSLGSDLLHGSTDL